MCSQRERTHHLKGPQAGKPAIRQTGMSALLWNDAMCSQGERIHAVRKLAEQMRRTRLICVAKFLADQRIAVPVAFGGRRAVFFRQSPDSRPFAALEPAFGRMEDPAFPDDALLVSAAGPRQQRSPSLRRVWKG